MSRKYLRKSPEQSPDGARQSETQGGESGLSSLVWVPLSRANLVVNRLQRPAIRCPDHVWDADPLAVDFGLDDDHDVDVVESNDPTPPVSIGLDRGMVLEGGRQTVHEKGRKGQFVPGLCFSLLDPISGFGDVELDESVNDAPCACHPHVIDRPSTVMWLGLERLSLGHSCRSVTSAIVFVPVSAESVVSGFGVASVSG